MKLRYFVWLVVATLLGLFVAREGYSFLQGTSGVRDRSQNEASEPEILDPGDRALEKELSLEPDAIEIDPPKTPEFLLRGDTNRDGFVDRADLRHRHSWEWKRGALIPFNHDDDNRNGIPDWQDATPISFARDRELALVRLRVPENLHGVPLFLQSDAVSRPYLRAFQRTYRGWLPVDLRGVTPILASQTIVFGLEASQFADGDWNGYVTLEATARQGGERLAVDRIALRVTPWLMLPNTATPQEIFASPLDLTDDFLPMLQQQTQAAGVPLTVDPTGLLWMQDTMEIGFVQFPSRQGLQVMPSVLEGIRDPNLDGFARSLLQPDTGWFSVAEPRELPPEDAWIDWYGNLEVTPPLPDYPWGRIYYGTADGVSMHPDILEFLEAQELQSPTVAIDTAWLHIRHVDEVVSFVPHQNGGFLMLVTSPEAGVQLLRDLERRGFGDAVMSRGLSTERTVREFLEDTDTIARNLQLQQQRVNPIVAQLQREFQVRDDRVVFVPALYGEMGDSLWPNLVNLVVLGDRLLVSDPQGAIVGGQDVLKAEFRRLLSSAGVRVSFIDDAQYHEMKGNLHCATNVRRQGSSRSFWSSLPQRLR
ncbi:protein-arginine deiminase family protein [Baaleninema sp.]|uniref:protein-arginine deiminase family protein n=1 Tax=Baaleninema sp. TaxID=3101197 RepID=UPI003CFD06D0